jgi:hypothetical protein
MNKAAIIVACLAISACAQMESRQYSPGGADKKQFARDEYECERDARSLRANDCEQMDMFEKCMTSKGYSAIPGTGNKGMCARWP